MNGEMRWEMGKASGRHCRHVLEVSRASLGIRQVSYLLSPDAHSLFRSDPVVRSDPRTRHEPMPISPVARVSRNTFPSL